MQRESHATQHVTSIGTYFYHCALKALEIDQAMSAVSRGISVLDCYRVIILKTK